MGDRHRYGVTPGMLYQLGYSACIMRPAWRVGTYGILCIYSVI